MNSCQEVEDGPTELVQKILEILYATEVNVRLVTLLASLCLNVSFFYRMALPLLMK